MKWSEEYFLNQVYVLFVTPYSEVDSLSFELLREAESLKPGKLPPLFIPNDYH